MIDIPEPFRDLWLQLDGNGSCYIGNEILNWQVSRGGAVMIHPQEESDTELWFGGAIRASYAGGGDPFYEMYLYHEGSLLRFLIDSRG